MFHNTAIAGVIGTGSLDTKVDFAAGAGPIDLALADIDGDGRCDIVVANSVDNSISVLRNAGTGSGISAGSFATKVDFATDIQPHSIAVSDFNGDGKPDLAVTNVISSTISLYVNAGYASSVTAGSFASKVDCMTGNEPFCAAIGDLDGDGKADLAVVNSGSDTVSIFVNTSFSVSTQVAGTVDPTRTDIVTIIPNPNNGTFTVSGALPTRKNITVFVEVVDLLGLVIYSENVFAKGGNLDEAISLGHKLAGGAYTLRLRTETEQINLPILILHQ